MKKTKYSAVKFAVVLIIMLLVVFSACEPKDPPEEILPDYPVKIGTATIKDKPIKVVSLSPAVTQTMFELEIGGRLTGISDNCPVRSLQPMETVEYLRCGTSQNPNIDVIRKIAPNVIITPMQMTDEDLRQLQQTGAEIVVLTTPQSLAELETYYTTLYRIMYGENNGVLKAEKFLENFNQKLDAVYDYANGLGATLEEPYSAVYIGPDLLNIATGDTLEGELLEYIGLVNWGADYTQFIYPKDKEVDLMPDVIYYNGYVNKAYITSSTCYKTTPAVKNGNVAYVAAFRLESRAPRSLIKVLTHMADKAYGA